jgi:hypothetical protein
MSYALPGDNCCPREKEMNNEKCVKGAMKGKERR